MDASHRDIPAVPRGQRHPPTPPSPGDHEEGGWLVVAPIGEGGVFGNVWHAEAVAQRTARRKAERERDELRATAAELGETVQRLADRLAAPIQPNDEAERGAVSWLQVVASEGNSMVPLGHARDYALTVLGWLTALRSKLEAAESRARLAKVKGGQDG